jgi:PAS domain S-box-containing protein
MVRKIKGKEEKALRFEGNLFRSFTETVKVLIIALDTEGKISFFNREAEEKLGYSREEVLGKSVEFLFPAPMREEVKSFTSSPDPSKIPKNQVLPLVSRSGETLIIDWAITLIPDKEGNLQAIVGIGTDITAKEAQLKRLDLLNKINQEIIVSDLKNLTPMASQIREVLDAHTVLILKTDKERKAWCQSDGTGAQGITGFPTRSWCRKFPRPRKGV